MTQYRTNNPLGSMAPRDLYDNAQNLDNWSNGGEPFYEDRFGVERKSWAGMEEDFAEFLASSGFETDVLQYVDGSPLTIDRPTQLLERQSTPGVMYSIKLPSAFPVILSGDWSEDESLLVVRVDGSLRDELADNGASLIGYMGRTQSEKNNDYPTNLDGYTLGQLPVIFIVGEQSAAATLMSDGDGMALIGQGEPASKLTRSGVGNFLTFDGLGPLVISNLTVEKGIRDSGHGIALIDKSNTHVRDITVDEFGGIGSGVIAYTTGGEDYTANTRNITYENITVNGDRENSTNTNGVLITNSDFSRVSGVSVSGIAAYGVEFKSLVRYSLASDLIIENSNVGYGHGQTTTDPTLGVSLSTVSNAVIKGCDVGILYGKGGFNVASNILIDSSGATSATPRAIRTTLNSTGNAFDNILIRGTYGEAVRFDSNRNFAGIHAHNTESGLLVLSDGVDRNAVEIKHPGTRLSVRDSISDSSGTPMSGVTANPVYCHATGEYLGTLGDRWRYTHSKVTGVSPLSSYRHVLEANGATGYAIASDGTAGCGYFVQFPTGNAGVTYSPSAYWQIAGFNWNARLSASYWQPSSDNVVTLGGAANRFSTVHAGTGSISTSDERSKQQIKPIDEAALRAWGRVEYVQYKFNDAVEQKGDGARWHFGLIAQRVKEAFEAEGLNAFDYGLLCYDTWEETPEVEEEPYRPAGNRYGIRYEEALALECAYLRSRLA